MDSETKQQLLERYERLPEDLQTLLVSDDIKQSLASIGTKNQLSDEQQNALEAEVTLILMGAVNVNTFIQSLVRELDISQSTAQNIGLAVDQEILTEVRQSFNDIQNLDTDPRESRGSEPPQKPQIPDKPSADPEQSEIHQPQPDAKRRPGKQPDPYREPVDEE